MKLIWSERPEDARAGFGPGRVGDLMEMLGGGCWSMGARFDYFIEPIRSQVGILYMLDQQTPDSPDGSFQAGEVVRRDYCAEVERLQERAQQWEDVASPGESQGSAITSP
jgi:hypothetical protein